MKQLFKIAALLTLALSLGGCATLFGDNGRQVSVNSNPQGADVYLNNQYMGKTPTTLVMGSIWNPSMLQVKAPGHRPVTTEINSKFQPVGLWNILFWPGFIIDAISGDMMKIAPESRNVTVSLEHGRMA